MYADGVGDGRGDGWLELLSSLCAYMCVCLCVGVSAHISLCALECVYMAVASSTSARCGKGDALMDEEHPLPFQQWKCLKRLGPRDGPCHSLPAQ